MREITGILPAKKPASSTDSFWTQRWSESAKTKKGPVSLSGHAG